MAEQRLHRASTAGTEVDIHDGSKGLEAARRLSIP
jgi:hypothetical protein